MGLKDKILSRLAAAEGETISGQSLAEEFSVSRNAVWKAVQSLKQDGYEIDSATNRGYALIKSGGKLSAPIIASLLERDIPIHIFDSIDSTNSEARRRIAAGESCCLVLAEEQTGGRGRRGKSFYSPHGMGLYMSLAISANFNFENAVGMTAFAAVSAVKAIKKLTGTDCGIKWVNDLYIGSKKICGILTEAVTDLESGTVAALVVGLGINLRSTELPEELESIVGFLDHAHIKNELAAEICNELMKYNGEDSSYMSDYRELSIVIGKHVAYAKNGESVSGKAVDIDSQGGLVVLRDDGIAETLRSGEISLTEIEGVK